ncbi:MAG: luciferase family protein [Solirubrobacteraceae bacterium]
MPGGITVLPDSGWVTFSIDEPGDVERAIELFRVSYERARRARRSPVSVAAGDPPSEV